MSTRSQVMCDVASDYNGMPAFAILRSLEERIKALEAIAPLPEE